MTTECMTADDAPARLAFLVPPATLPDGVDAFERAKRWELVKSTWADVPRHQLEWRCAPVLVRAVTEWRVDRSIILMGVTGTGKTTACVKLVHRLVQRAMAEGGEHIARARSVLWVDADDLTRSGGSRDVGDYELLERARRSRVLVLDDVASPSKTLLSIIRARLKRRVPTVVTCGAVDVPGLEEALGGKAVVRHLLEATGTFGSIFHAREVPR